VPRRHRTAYMGCVLPAGLGQAPARQAVIAACPNRFRPPP
jgi:acetyl-CoA acetyltransferase